MVHVAVTGFFLLPPLHPLRTIRRLLASRVSGDRRMRARLTNSRLGGGRLLLALTLLIGSVGCGSAAPSAKTERSSYQSIPIWPGQAPDTEGWTGPELAVDAELPNIGKVHIITNVTVPTITVFRPPAGKANGTAVVVVPGGAFRALPWDLDGVEPAAWLTQRGITAFVLKYRVRPPQSGSPPDRSFQDFAVRTEAARAISVSDAQQAVRLVRSRAEQFGVVADRIGMIGFSAGAMATVEAADASDASARPNFAAALYGALLKPSGPSADAAPLFIVAAQDDREAPSQRSAELFTRWTSANRPAEIHIYDRGGHGFGFRPRKLPVDGWTEALEKWLTSWGYIPAGKTN